MYRVDKILEMLEKSPNDAFLQHALALEHIKLNEPDEAIRIFEALLNQTPDYTGSYYHLGGLYARKGEKDKALDVYNKGLFFCKAAGENRAFNELQSAIEDLSDEE